MARRKTKTLTELELEIMNIVWRHDEVIVEEVAKVLADSEKPLATPTIRTMLGILQDKGYVDRRPVGRAFAYRARVSREQARRRILRDLVERAFEGSALDLVAAIFNTKIVSKRELDQVKRLIRDYEKEEKK